MTLGCGGDGSGPSGASAPPALTGTVVDAATRAAVAGATVAILDGALSGRTATTDGSGAFRIEGVQAAFAYRVTQTGYKPLERSVTGGGTAVAEGAVALHPEPCATPSCGGPNECTRVLAFLQKPFSGNPRMSSQFDHNVPLGFGSENAVFVNRCGVRANYDGHNGYDWVMPVGTPVLAVADGRVSFAGEETPFFCPLLGRQTAGTSVMIRHTSPTGESFRTVYLHLSALAVTNGQGISAGETLGASGNTGCSTGPHLHFGVFREFDATGRRLPAGAEVATDPFGWQGPGEDPWSVAERGAYSAWLWANPPALLSSEGEGPREMHSPDLLSLGSGIGR
jgi:hypothetical protein